MPLIFFFPSTTILSNELQLNKQYDQVYAESADLLNIASSGTATQANSAYKGFAELAIDGNTNGDFEL